MIAHEPAALIQALRQAAAMVAFYGTAIRQIAPRGGLARRRVSHSAREDLVFVVGAPRSGTTFLAETIASCPGFVDLGETTPLKALVPRLHPLPPDRAARHLRGVLERVRRLSLVRGLRGVEQTPELAFLLPAIMRAYPRARGVHILRDGRDVACSLLERGWLSATRAGRDDAGHPYGPRPRFWVEPERAQEFERASDATRAAWAWRAYVTAARTPEPSDAVLVVRYEDLARNPELVAGALADHLGINPEPLLSGLALAHDRSIGRFRRDLTPSRLEEVEREAGALLEELGYPLAGTRA
jgi:hypothetical protein